MILPTVRVKGGSKGSRIINESDFDPKVHELADPPARDPLDHDGDGRKGGSMPDPVASHAVEISESDLAKVISASAEKPVPKPRAKARKKGK